MLMVHWGFPDLGLEHGWSLDRCREPGISMADREITRTKVEPTIQCRSPRQVWGQNSTSFEQKDPIESIRSSRGQTLGDF